MKKKTSEFANDASKSLAWPTWVKSQAGMKYGKEFYDGLVEYLASHGLTIDKTNSLYHNPDAILALEARARTEITKKYNRVFEPAAGLGIQGLNATQQNPSKIYGESDFSDVIRLKTGIIKRKGIVVPKGRLFFESGDITDRAHFEDMARKLDLAEKLRKKQGSVIVDDTATTDEGIGIPVEGCFRFLTPEQKSMAFKNAAWMLANYGGGILIANGIMTKDEVSGTVTGMDKATQMNTTQNHFENMEHLGNTVADAGLKIEFFNVADLIDISQLTLAKDFGLTDDQVEKALRECVEATKISILTLDK
jgi:hypothetical protein